MLSCHELSPGAVTSLAVTSLADRDRCQADQECIPQWIQVGKMSAALRPGGTNYEQYREETHNFVKRKWTLATLYDIRRENTRTPQDDIIGATHVEGD